MRNRKYIKIALVLFLAALIPTYTFSDLDFKVASIDVIDEGTLEIGVNDNLEDTLAIDSDMQVVEDTMSVKEAIRDYENLKQVKVELNEDLVPGEYYSLISITGADGNMAFTFPENFYDLDSYILPGEELSGIISLEIKSSRELIVNFENDADTSVEVKLLRELGITNLEKTSARTIKVTLDKQMQSNKNYTLTVIKLSSFDGKEVSLENSTVDFVAPEFNIPEMEAAPEEVEAPVKKELPPTGTKENIIIILSMLIGGVIVYRREKMHA